MEHVESVGIRALKQNASAVVARVVGGEALEITDRGRPVARITPIRGSRLSELQAAGLLRPARMTLSEMLVRRGGRLAESGSGAPDGGAGSANRVGTSDKILDELREERMP